MSFNIVQYDPSFLLHEKIVEMNSPSSCTEGMMTPFVLIFLISDSTINGSLTLKLQVRQMFWVGSMPFCNSILTD